MFPALAIGAGLSWLLHREVLNRPPDPAAGGTGQRGALPAPPVLDANLEPSSRAGVMNLLAGGTPAQLDQAAHSLLRSGYPYAAHACMQRAHQLAQAMAARDAMKAQYQAAQAAQAAQQKDMQSLQEAAAALRGAAPQAPNAPPPPPAARRNGSPGPTAVAGAPNDDTGKPKSSAPPEDRPKVPSVSTRRRTVEKPQSAARAGTNGANPPPPSGVDLSSESLDETGEHANGRGAGH